MLGYQLGELREPRFIANPNQLKTTVMPRTWRQRLFTWPWRPWVTTATVTVPDPSIHFEPCTMTYYGHPSTLKAFRQLCEDKGQGRNS